MLQKKFEIRKLATTSAKGECRQSDCMFKPGQDLHTVSAKTP